MIAPRVQIYIQPTPYTIGEMLPGSYVTMTTRLGQVLCEYRAGEAMETIVPDNCWPVNINVNLPGFNQFNCKIMRFENRNGVASGGYNDTLGLP